MKVKGLKLQLGRNRLGWAGAPRGESDPLSWAPRAQQDQCVWIQANSAHNEGKWEFNTNFLTKCFRPPASVVVLTCPHPCLHHHHLYQCNHHNKMSETPKHADGCATLNCLKQAWQAFSIINQCVFWMECFHIANFNGECVDSWQRIIEKEGKDQMAVSLFRKKNQKSLCCILYVLIFSMEINITEIYAV